MRNLRMNFMIKDDHSQSKGYLVTVEDCRAMLNVQ